MKIFLILLCIFGVFTGIAMHDKIINDQLILLELSLLGKGWDCYELDLLLNKANETILFNIGGSIQELYDERNCGEEKK